MATDRTHRVIMAKTMFGYFLDSNCSDPDIYDKDIHTSFKNIKFRPNPIPK